MALHVTAPSLGDKLERLIEEFTSFMVLGHQLREQTRTVLEEIAATQTGADLRKAGRAYLANASSHELREALIEARGAKAAANFRTKLNSDLEQHRGRRHPINGRAHVGNGTHSAV
jgi:hypothetical protein